MALDTVRQYGYFKKLCDSVYSAFFQRMEKLQLFALISGSIESVSKQGFDMVALSFSRIRWVQIYV